MNEYIFRVYCSHAITGTQPNPTDETMAENCQIAKDIVDALRELCPQIDFYLPAEHEDFVHRAYKKKMMTVPQILEIDGDILRTCDGVIFLCWEDSFSSGMKYEADIAVEIGMPSTILYYTDYIEKAVLDKFLTDLKSNNLETRRIR